MTHELAAATRVLATTCCVCGRDLCDAKSVELGIGPVCRKRYFRDADIPLTSQGWEKALGVLVQSGLPMHIVDSVLARRPNTRKAANVVVYWASANHTSRDIVLACAGIVRYLGFTTLADKLERDRSDIRFETDGARINIFTKRHDGFNRGLRRLGARMVRHERGRFKCWAVPSSSKDKLIVLAGVHFGGLKCFADEGIFTIEPKTWADFDAMFPARPTAAPAPAPATNLGITLTTSGKVIRLDTPFDAAFVAAIRRVRGRRYEGGSINSFPSRCRQRVTDLVQTYFGVAV